jgi:hypothetical protein
MGSGQTMSITVSGTTDVVLNTISLTSGNTGIATIGTRSTNT